MTEHSLPRGVTERMLTLAVSGIDIPAALTLPAAEPMGAVLLIPGSLFCDVNGDFPVWKSYPRVYAWLAEQLAERGLAVYRFAKLGPGTGSVDTDAARAKAVKTWDGRAVIARAALAHFRALLANRPWDAGRAGNPHGHAALRLVLAGHSEGAVVASVLGRDGVEADGIVLLSGPSVGILEIMIEQGAAMPGSGGDAQQSLRDVVVCLRERREIDDDLKRRASGSFGAGALVQMPPDAQAYMRDCDATDPCVAIAAYDGPVLIVQGGADSSVPAHHAEALRAARGTRATTVTSFPDLQHCYKRIPDGTPPMEAFGLPGPTDERVADAISRFVRDLPVSADAR
jgi:pimeloyl-ACP methyl ester carboxylesterase